VDAYQKIGEIIDDSHRDNPACCGLAKLHRLCYFTSGVN
jgi:hypothetical protein